MRVEIIPCLRDNYSYLIINENNNDACVVDPSEAKPVIDFINKNNINLKYILNTHHHYDHIGGNKELKEKYNATVVGFKNDAKRIPEIDVLVEIGGNNKLYWPTKEFPVVYATASPGDSIKINYNKCF